MADRPGSDDSTDGSTDIGIVAGAVDDRTHAVVACYAKQDVTDVASALFGDRAAEQSRENAEIAGAAEKVLAAVGQQAAGADLLVVYLSGALELTGGAGTPQLTLVDPQRKRTTIRSLDIAGVVMAASGAKALMVIIDGVIEPAGIDRAALAKRVGRQGDSTCLLIGTRRRDSSRQNGYLKKFVRVLGAVLGGRRPGMFPRGQAVTAGVLVGRLVAQRESSELVSHVGAQFARDLPSADQRPSRRSPWETVRSWTRRTKVAVATGVVVVLLGAVALVALPLGSSSPDPEAVCLPPLELRVLSSPEGFPAMREAAATFANQRRDQNDCRLVHPTVYQATTDAALRGFGQATRWARPSTGAATGGADASCPGVGGSEVADRNGPPAGASPGRDIGPRPDVWLPDSTSDVDRARCAASVSAVDFGRPTSVAWSPLVLGVYQPTGDQYFSDQDDWAALDKNIRQAGLDLVRPNPATSSAGLLHTVSMYEVLDDGPALEGRVMTETLPLSDSTDLLCRLASVPYPNRAGPAVLVSETSLVNYNLGTLPDCPAGEQPGASTSLQAHYPAGTPALDHPFVDLTWTDEPGSRARTDAVDAFRRWLLSDEGQRTLAGAGLRPVREVRLDRDPLGRPGSGARRDPPSPAPQPDITRVRQVLKSYADAHEPGRVAFLLDVSLSMSANGSLETAKGLIGSSVGLMGGKDQVALTTVPRTTGDSAELNVVVPVGAPSSGTEIRARLGGVTAQRNGVALYAAIDRQMALLAANPGPAKQTLVVLTGGEDIHEGVPLSGQTVEDLVARYQPNRRATVQVVAFSPATCGGDLGRLAAALGGPCISSVDNSTPATVVAGVWQGSGDA